MNAATPRTLLLWLFVLASACEMDRGPILVPDAGEDAGPEPDGGTDAGDQQAPEVVETTPAHGATDVATDAAIVIRFSEAMNESAGTVAIEIDGASPGAPAASWSEDGTALTLTPAAALASSARVRVTVRADFADRSGNTLPGPTVFAFDVADVEAPRATASTPAEGASGVPGRLDAIEIVFSEAMSATGTLTFEGGDGTVGDPVWSTASVRFPVRGLEYDTAYRVVLDGFTDAAGNALDGTGYLGDGALDFTTGPDVDGPIVVDSNPDEGQVNVSLRFLGAIVIELDEPMDTSVTEVELTVPGAVRTLTGTWSADARTITFPLAGELAPNGAHSLDLSALRDAAGNALDGVAYLFDGRLDFVTGADDVVPAVVFATPGEGTVEATFRDTELRLVFNQAMDTSTTTLAFDDGTGPVDLTGTWNLAGTRLTFDVTDTLRSETAYTLDAREMRDATGRPLDVSHSYLVDGILDFTTIAGNGENCRDALTVPTSTTATGGLVFEIGERQVIEDDGSMSCDTNGIPADAVIRYRKTTAEGGTSGGRWLHVRAFDIVGGLGEGVRVNVEIFAGTCDPRAAGAAAARQTCLAGAPTWNSYLAAPAGDYFIWVSHTAGATFRPITVVVEEIDAPPHGESCTDPLTTSSAGFYTAPATASDPHVWELPEGAFGGHDIDPMTGGPGTITCDSDGEHGPDAVIRFEKAASDSVLDVQIESISTELPGLSFELLDRCDGASPEASSLACTTDLRRLSSSGPPNARSHWVRAPAGPVFAWVAAGRTYGVSPPSRVSIREVPASPGIDCSNAIPITPGTTVPVTPVAERLFPPSCAPATANLTWYRVQADQRVLLVTGTTADPAVDGAVAIIDAATDAELSCVKDIEQTFASAFLQPGDERCIAVESGSVTSLTVEAVPYDGLRGDLTDLLIDRPFNASGSERGLASSQWMQVTPTTVYLGVGTGTSAMSISNFLAFASRTGGFRAEVNDAYQGPVNGYAAQAIGEAIFTVDDSATAGTAPRLHRIIDSLGTFSIVPWDTGTSYPGYSIRSIAYDGTDLWLVSHATTASHQTRVWKASPTAPGPLADLGEIPGLQRVLGIAIDGTYMYLAATADGSAGVFRIPHADIVDPLVTPVPERIATLALPSATTDVVLDDPADPGNLYVRSTTGVHVIRRPASAEPRDLGLLVAVTGSGRPMTLDAVSGSLYLIDTASSDQPFLRVD